MTGPTFVTRPGSAVKFPVGRDFTVAELAESSLETTVRDEYTGSDLRFMGMTRLDAAVLSLVEDATEFPGARSELLDRIMGKPRQRVDAQVVTFSLTDYLTQLVEEDLNSPEGIPVADAVSDDPEVFR